MTKQKQLDHFISEILAWNKKINLTGLKIRTSIQTILIDQSLEAGKHIPDDQPVKIIDVGTGAGIPGIPLKIRNPQIILHLVDRNHKKTAFIKKIVRDLALEHVTVHTCDYQELLKDPQHQNQYAFVLVRGLGANEKEITVLREFLAPQGKILIWEGDNQNLNIRIIT